MGSLSFLVCSINSYNIHFFLVFLFSFFSSHRQAVNDLTTLLETHVELLGWLQSLCTSYHLS